MSAPKTQSSSRRANKRSSQQRSGRRFARGVPSFVVFEETLEDNGLRKMRQMTVEEKHAACLEAGMPATLNETQQEAWISGAKIRGARITRSQGKRRSGPDPRLRPRMAA